MFETNMNDEISQIKAELNDMHHFFSKVVKIMPSFHITDPKILPYGLKPHTRSVSWIVEQVIVQQAKYNKEGLGVKDVDFDLSDTKLYDCEVLTKADKRYFINIKITSAKRQNKNDIAAVEKLYKEYKSKSDFRLIYAVFQFSFDNTKITFNKDKIHTFSPQFLPIYVNPSNGKIQAYYYAGPEERTREEFLSLLQENSRSIRLR